MPKNDANIKVIKDICNEFNEQLKNTKDSFYKFSFMTLIKNINSMDNSFELQFIMISRLSDYIEKYKDNHDDVKKAFVDNQEFIKAREACYKNFNDELNAYLTDYVKNEKDIKKIADKLIDIQKMINKSGGLIDKNAIQKFLSKNNNAFISNLRDELLDRRVEEHFNVAKRALEFPLTHEKMEVLYGDKAVEDAIYLKIFQLELENEQLDVVNSIISSAVKAGKDLRRDDTYDRMDNKMRTLKDPKDQRALMIARSAGNGKTVKDIDVNKNENGGYDIIYKPSELEYKAKKALKDGVVYSILREKLKRITVGAKELKLACNSEANIYGKKYWVGIINALEEFEEMKPDNTNFSKLIMPFKGLSSKFDEIEKYINERRDILKKDNASIDKEQRLRELAAEFDVLVRVQNSLEKWEKELNPNNKEYAEVIKDNRPIGPVAQECEKFISDKQKDIRNSQFKDEFDRAEAERQKRLKDERKAFEEEKAEREERHNNALTRKKEDEEYAAEIKLKEEREAEERRRQEKQRRVLEEIQNNPDELSEDAIAAYMEEFAKLDKQQEEEKKRAEEDARIKAEEERKKAEEEKKRAEEEEKKKAEEEAKKKQQEEAKKKQKDEAQKKADEEKALREKYGKNAQDIILGKTRVEGQIKYVDKIRTEKAVNIIDEHGRVFYGRKNQQKSMTLDEYDVLLTEKGWNLADPKDRFLANALFNLCCEEGNVYPHLFDSFKNIEVFENEPERTEKFNVITEKVLDHIGKWYPENCIHSYNYIIILSKAFKNLDALERIYTSELLKLEKSKNPSDAESIKELKSRNSVIDKREDRYLRNLAKARDAEDDYLNEHDGDEPEYNIDHVKDLTDGQVEEYRIRFSKEYEYILDRLRQSGKLEILQNNKKNAEEKKAREEELKKAALKKEEPKKEEPKKVEPKKAAPKVQEVKEAPKKEEPKKEESKKAAPKVQKVKPKVQEVKEVPKKEEIKAKEEEPKVQEVKEEPKKAVPKVQEVKPKVQEVKEAPKKEEIKAKEEEPKVQEVKEAPKKEEPAAEDKAQQEIYDDIYLGLRAYDSWKKKLTDQLNSDLEKNGQILEGNGDLKKSLQDLINILRDDKKNTNEIINGFKDVNDKAEAYRKSVAKNIKKLPKDNPRVKLDEFAKDKITQIQNSLMNFKTYKSLIGSTAMETKDNISFREAGIADIKEKLNSLGAKDNQAKNTPDKVKKLSDDIANATEMQIRILNKIKNDHKVKLDLTESNTDKYILIKSSKPSVRDLANQYIFTSYTEKTLSKRAIEDPERLESIFRRVNDKNFISKKIDSFVKNPVFKDFSKQHPEDCFSAWQGVKKEVKELRQEYADRLKDYEGKNLYKFIMGDENSDIKDWNSMENRYLRFASVMTAKILSDKNNKLLLQGVVTGKYDLMAIEERIHDALKERKLLDGLTGFAIGATSFNLDYNSGEIEKNIYSKLLADKNIKIPEAPKQNVQKAVENNAPKK